MKRFLIAGYGNPDREDDGVAWHILCTIALRLGLPAPPSYEEPFTGDERLDLAFSLQLAPEMAEDIHEYQYICFVDAHTGNIPVPVRLTDVQSEFQASPFTHHLTPQSLLSICETIYGHRPDAALLSVRGHRFGLSRELSERTAGLVPQAVDLLWKWLSDRKGI